MKRRLSLLLLAALAVFAATACSSLEPMLPTFNSRERAYKARLAEVAFPTSRARLYTAFPPAGKVTVFEGSFTISANTLPPSVPFRQRSVFRQGRIFIEEYPLDAAFAIRMEVSPLAQTTDEMFGAELNAALTKRAASRAARTDLVLSAQIIRLRAPSGPPRP